MSDRTALARYMRVHNYTAVQLPLFGRIGLWVAVPAYGLSAVVGSTGA